MKTVADLAAWMEGFAPARLAESWDNVGLLWGDPEGPVGRIMTCLTVADATADEAIAEGAGAIVSHHPVLFRATKSIRADRPETGFLWRLARAGVAVLSPHTAYDNTVGGINDQLAERLGLRDVGAIRNRAATLDQYKVVVFAPGDDREAILGAIFAAGAGRIGDYEECSFTLEGSGTFHGREGTNPAVGEAGRRETVAEQRIEFVCPPAKLDAAIGAMLAAHSYEEPAYDIYPLHTTRSGPGSGRIGELAEATSLGALAATLRSMLPAPGLQFAGELGHPVKRVAIVCGAGDDFLPDAARAGADVLLTGEARYHRGVEAESLGIGLIVAGHHATERPGVERLAELIAEAFPESVAWASRRERDPFRSL